jgi:CubicO group peptidase (beta-lactamase class C family)
MIFVDEGRLDLDAPLSTWFPAFAGPGRGGARVHHLLSHSSGLPAWAPLSRESRGKEGVIQAVLARDLEYEPGTRSVYSDLGMILLGQIIEHQGGEALDQLARRRVFEPLGMRDTAYRPPASVRERVASTGEDRWRGRVLRGEVQDENAYWMGGVAGHAGLFGTAPNLARFCEMLLRGGDWGGRRLVRSETVDWFARRVEISGSTRTLGWETPAGDRWAGGGWSARAFGHTGLTGTVVWIDPELDVYLVLLTNRIAMGGSDEAFGHVRRQLSEAVTNVVRRGLVVQSTSGASLERSGHAKRATGEGVQGCASADDSTQSGAASPCLLREPAFLSCDLLSSALTRASIREKYRSASNLKPFQPLKR